MRITFYGAADEVTGSCHLLEVAGKHILIDCGMFQGGDFNEGRNADDFAFNPQKLDAVIVTHAHTDHSGRIPKLIRDGYLGPIYMTKGTRDLAELIWMDAFHIMEYNNKKFQTPILFTPEEIATASENCVGVNYHERIDLGAGISFVLKDAGHIFGSAFVELTGEGKTIVFSGDIGNVNLPIVKDTEPLNTPDILVCESTYGDRIHETVSERKELILKLLKEGLDRGGTIMVPTFSIERTQEFLYLLDELSEEDHSLPNVPVYLDSPMAINAIPVYRKYTEYYDEDAAAKHAAGDDFLTFPELIITRSSEESKRINSNRLPKIIIAGAGMMNGGRIIHHLYRYLSDPNSTLIITGYQAKGTLGRQLFEKAKRVMIFGEMVDVHCTVKAIGAMSGHGDQNKLTAWIADAKKRPEHIYFVHGEKEAAEALANRVEKDLHIKTTIPKVGESFMLSEVGEKVGAEV